MADLRTYLENQIVEQPNINNSIVQFDQNEIPSEIALRELMDELVEVVE